MKKFNDGPSGLARLIAAMGLVFAPLAGAMIVVISGPAGTPIEVLRDAAQGDAAGSARQGLGFARTDSDTLTAALSPPKGSVAYVWSDRSVRILPGFRAPSGSRFENGLAPSGLQKPAAAKAALPVFSTAFSNARLEGEVLSISYSVAKGGPMTLEAFGLDGKVLGSWNWSEAAAGAYRKSLSMKTGKSPSVIVLRWTHDGKKTLKRIQGFRR